MKEDVFISHNIASGRSTAKEFVKLLDMVGVSSWMADEKFEKEFGGIKLPRSIDHRVRSARVVLVLWSQKAKSSDWMVAEAVIGKDNESLVQLGLDDVTSAELSTPVNVVDIHRLEGWDRKGTHPAWAAALRQIGALLNRPGLDTLFELKAMENPSEEEWEAWARRHPFDPFAQKIWTQSKRVRNERFEKQVKTLNAKTKNHVRNLKKHMSEKVDEMRLEMDHFLMGLPNNPTARQPDVTQIWNATESKNLLERLLRLKRLPNLAPSAELKAVQKSTADEIDKLTEVIRDRDSRITNLEREKQNLAGDLALKSKDLEDAEERENKLKTEIDDLRRKHEPTLLRQIVSLFKFIFKFVVMPVLVIAVGVLVIGQFRQL